MTREDVHLSESLKTPQFYLLWLILCLNVTAGIGIIGVAMTGLYAAPYRDAAASP